jgi:hypothetical protein
MLTPARKVSRMSGSPPRLELSIKNHFVPILRADGFSGSGRNFRRVASDLILALQVQSSRDGGKFAVNLGIHPLAVPDALGGLPDPKKIVVTLCELRRRLSEHGSDQWWGYEATQTSMDEAVVRAARVYEMTGRRLFAEQTSPSSPLYLCTSEKFGVGDFDLSGFATTKARLARLFSIMRGASGNRDEQRAFARIGLESVGRATALKIELEALCALAP